VPITVCCGPYNFDVTINNGGLFTDHEMAKLAEGGLARPFTVLFKIPFG
jgi:hypothetical protein